MSRPDKICRRVFAIVKPGVVRHARNVDYGTNYNHLAMGKRVEGMADGRTGSYLSCREGRQTKPEATDTIEAGRGYYHSNKRC